MSSPRPRSLVAHPGVLAAVLACLLALSGELTAQIHKDTRRGFQFNAPKGFNALALQPGSSNPVARFQSDRREVAGNTSLFATFELNYYPLSRRKEGQSTEEYMDELWDRIENAHGFAEVEREKKIKMAKTNGLEKHFAPDGKPIMIFAAMVEQDDGVFVFEGVSLSDRFKKTVKDFAKAARSFKRIEKESTEDRDAERAQMTDQERFLAEQIERLPAGWDHLRTDRYLFLYNAEKGFVKDLSKQIEVIRDTYEELYPPDEPIEAVSIVRVCDSRDTYRGYGGPDGSGGYWSWVTQELVIFDNPPRDVTHAILNHEAFHQYIFYYYGQLSPHSWYNEGHGDYFAGAKMTKTWRIRGFDDAPGGVARKEAVKRAVGERRQGRGGATPLKDLLRFTQAEYYENGGMHYAQGWAVVHMLREARLKPRWQRILPDYLDALLAARLEVATELMDKEIQKAEKRKKGSSDSLDKDPENWFSEASIQHGDEVQARAYDKTFEGWTVQDWEEFDDFWMDYVERL